jgi:hypothetical protein
LLSVDPAAIPPEILKRLRFAERRFDHSFRLDGESARAAGIAALDARRNLLDLLIGIDPTRWDWLAARGITGFWIGYRVHDDDPEARFAALSDAIRDLSAAKAMAGDAFPPESTYWLTEARRWLPLRDDDKRLYLSLVAEGAADYVELRAAVADDDWNAPLDRAELLASNGELLAKVADFQAGLVFDLSDRWDPADPAVQKQILDALAGIAAWDTVRRLAIDAGSIWSSNEPGYSNAPAYLLGTVGGRLRLERKPGAPADECDLLASFPADPLRRAASTAFADLDPDKAISTCRALWQEDEEDPRLSFMLGRLLWSSEERATALDLLKVAADGDYGAAFNSLAGYLEVPGGSVTDGDALHLKLRYGFAQRAVRDAYADVHAYLAPLATTPEHAAGLRWLSERAAALGLPEAHVALARLADTSPEDRAYHLMVASLIYEEDGNEEQSEEVLADIDKDYYVDAADRAEDGWQVEVPFKVPSDLIEELKGVTN